MLWLSRAAPIAVLLLMCGRSVAAQPVSPCCDKICSDGTSTACNAIVPNAGARDGTAQGCVETELRLPDTVRVCSGGTLVGSKVVSGCLCALEANGAAVSCVDESGHTISTADCTKRAVEHCGQNVRVTPDDPTCPAGRGCDVGQTNCGPDNCVDTTSDPANCGGCGKTCPSGKVCRDSACTTTCSAGETACGDHCADTSKDKKNCGACGKVCSRGETCRNGKCTCPSGKTDCYGTCVDISHDKKNCGACGSSCSDGQTCQSGMCRCPSGQTERGGKCVDTSKAEESGSKESVGAASSCPPGQVECNGVCVDKSKESYCRRRRNSIFSR